MSFFITQLTTVIASRSTLIVGVRCPAASEVYELVQRVLPCLEAAAMATGCDFEIKRQALYMDTQQASGLSDYLRQVSKSKWDLPVPDMPTTASTDFVRGPGDIMRLALTCQGMITYAMPALHPMFNLPDAREGDFPRELRATQVARSLIPDSDHFAKSTCSESATDATLEAASAIAVVGSRIVLDQDWADSVTRAWRRDMEARKLWDIQHKLEHRVEKYPLVDYLKPMEEPEHACSC